MKQIFFTSLAIAIPVIAFGGVVYMFFLGLYRLFDDWRLGRELRQLRNEAAQRRSEHANRVSPSFDPLSAFDDQPPPQERTGIAVLPLDPAWPPVGPRATDTSAELQATQEPALREPAPDTSSDSSPVPRTDVAETLTSPSEPPPSDPTTVSESTESAESTTPPLEDVYEDESMLATDAPAGAAPDTASSPADLTETWPYPPGALRTVEEESATSPSEPPPPDPMTVSESTGSESTTPPLEDVDEDESRLATDTPTDAAPDTASSPADLAETWPYPPGSLRTVDEESATSPSEPPPSDPTTVSESTESATPSVEERKETFETEENDAEEPAIDLVGDTIDASETPADDDNRSEANLERVSDGSEDAGSSDADTEDDGHAKVDPPTVDTTAEPEREDWPNRTLD